MIKRFILLFALFPALSYAGDYDGIWEVQPGLIFTIHENASSQIVAIILQSQAWQAEMGALDGNIGSTQTVLGNVNLKTNFNFITTTQLEITIESCVPVTQPCLFPNGTVLSANKVF